MRFFTILLFLQVVTMLPAQDFIRVKDGQFQWKSKPYYFIGTNFWYGMNLGMEGEQGDRARLITELDHLKALGVTNLRIMGWTNGTLDAPWQVHPTVRAEPEIINEYVLEGLDFLMVELAKREMHAVICLNNFWPWTGGMAQYVQWFSKKNIPYPPPAEGGTWWKYMKYTSRFYKNKAAKKAFEQDLSTLVNRRNTISGIEYKNDPTIMAWQIANEPRGVLRPKAMNRWILETAALIKKLDPNHLVSLGSEGNTSSFTAGNDFLKNHSSPFIDYTTIHIWIQNWLWYDPLKAEQTYPKALDKALKYIQTHVDLAKKIGKPLVLEEFGIARDQNSHDPEASTTYRDQYYEAIFTKVYQQAVQGNPLTGCNFWAWAGQGRPKQAEGIWQKGDDLIGDPPHEYQGWYSVYDKDKSTLAIIEAFAKKMRQLGRY